MATRNRNIARAIGRSVRTGTLTASGAIGQIDSSALASSLQSISLASLSNVDLTVNPETLEIQTVSSGPGQNTNWLWTWTRSALPYARIPITNVTQTNVPLYKQGTYTVNNYSGFDSDAFANGGDSNDQIHRLFLKWIDGAGTQNLVSWVNYDSVNDDISTINNGATTKVQRLTISVPDSSTFALPTLTAPSVSYNITDSGLNYVFSGAAEGAHPNLGPWRRGGTYTLNVNATGHPLYLTTDNGTNFVSGSYVSEYTTGVTGSRNTDSALVITVDSSAPDTLYYQCGNHAAMRGEITIKNLEVERNNNGNYVLYLQHGQEGMKNTAEIRKVPTLADQMCIVYDATNNKFVPQDLATYVERTPSFKNKIQEVAGTATLVAADGTAIVASVEVVNDASYLPLSGNSVGDLVYATDTETIYVWDGTQWQQNTAGIDSAGITTLIDSSYVASRAPAASTFDSDNALAITPYTVALRQDGTLSATTGTAKWYAPSNITVTEAKARVGTAPTGSGIAIRVNKSGDSNSTINIAATETLSTIAPTLTMTDSDYITIDVTGVGSTVAGADLYVQFTYTRD